MSDARPADRDALIAQDLREEYLHLRRVVETAHDYLQGEFYAEALGVLDDAITGSRVVTTTERRGPIEPDNSMVICPYCTSQFVAIPVNTQERLKGSQEYSIQLQRLIERFCTGDPLPYPELHHHRLLAALRPEELTSKPTNLECGDCGSHSIIEVEIEQPEKASGDDSKPYKTDGDR